MPRGAARPHTATRQLCLLLLLNAAAALTQQEQELFNRRIYRLYGRKEVWNTAIKQAVLATETEDLKELETEHYGRLHAKHPVRHCCAAEECAADSA